MALTITGNKYNGTLTSISVNSVIDTTKGFTSSDFSEVKPRMVWLFKGGNPEGFARTASASGNTITLDAPFVDIDGNEVTQVIGDTYYVSLIFAERAGAGMSVSNNLITCTDKIVFGTSGDNSSVFIHAEGSIFTTNVAGTNSEAPYEVNGGCVSFGNPVSIKNRLTSSGCTFYSSTTVSGHGMCIKSTSASSFHFGTTFVYEDGNTGRMPGGAGAGGYTPAYLQMYLNCVSNGNFVAPSGGANWSTRPNFQRLINLNSAGGGNNFINSRWSNGFFEGGQFKNSGAGLAPFGSDSVGTYEVSALAGERISIFDTARQRVWRSNGAVNQTINFTNVLVADADKSAMFGVTTSTNDSATLFFKFKEKYNNLINGTKLYIKDVNDTLAYSETIGVSGESQDISLTYEFIDLPNAPVRYNPWAIGIYKYGFGIVDITADVIDVVLGSNNVKDLIFGGPIAQGADISITEADKTIVDAYTEITNAREFYDVAASFLEDNYVGEITTIVARSGNEIDAGSYNIIIDSTATNVFAFDGTTITIKSNVFTGNLKTTGTVTQKGAPKTITYGIDGTLIIEDASAPWTVNGNVVIDDIINNDAANNLVINLTGGATAFTTEPGTGNGEVSIITSATLTITTNVTGADFVILQAGTNTVLDSVDQHPTNSYSFLYTVTGDVDIGVIKQGYIVRYEYGITLTGTDATIPINLITDRNYG